MEAPATNLDKLIQLGFEPVTEWIMKGGRIGPPHFKWRDHSGCLYAFVVSGEVKYVGLTSRILRSRMSDYSHINNSQTNGLRDKIVAELAAGRRVEIFRLKQSDPVVLATDEARLRRELRPP